MAVRAHGEADTDARSMGVRVPLWLQLVAWTLLIAGFAVWDYQQSYLAVLATATEVARDNYNKDLVYRRWASMHGGVYVPVTETTPPNPYLTDVFERDITTPSGRKLTLINPAYMTRQVHELGQTQYGIRAHITSLKPLRPENAPDPWEAKALQQFAAGSKEIVSLELMEGVRYLRFMKPLITEASCLKCHGFQGYRTGEVRGGLSVSTPWQPFMHGFQLQQRSEGLVYGLVWVAGVILFSLWERHQRQLLSARQQALALVQASEEQYRTILQAAMDSFVLMDGQGQLLAVNDAYCRMSGYAAPELLTLRLADLDAGAAAATDIVAQLQQFAGQGGGRFEFRHRRKDANSIDVEISVQYRTPEGGRFVCFLRDITDRKLAQAAVAASLHEKETLLKEIHHRVKNNLQIISSLLRLQGGQIDNPIAKAALRDMQSRVRSMALIHEHLYRSENLAQVDMVAYLKSLCQHAFRALVTDQGAIRLHLDMATLRLGIDQAIPCGLLANELVSNALKHAFPDGRSGELRVELQPVPGGSAWRLCVTDNGIGLPAAFDLKTIRSLGLQLVPDLVNQIRGRLEIGPGPGASFAVTFTPVTPA